MRFFKPGGTFSLALAGRTHVITLYLLAYFILCLKLDGRVSRAEAWAGLGFFVLLQLAYLVNKLYDRTEDAFNGEPVLFSWSSRPFWRNGFTAVFLLAAAGLVFLDGALFPVVLYSAAVTFAYSHPRLRLKEIFFLKPFINTLNFFLVAVISPFLLYDQGAWAYAPRLFWGAGRLLLMVLSLTLLFDVRDMRGDAASGLRTLPLLFGRGPVVLVIAAVSLAFALASFYAGAYLGGGNQLLIAAFALGALRERARGYYDALVFCEIAFLSLLFIA